MSKFLKAKVTVRSFHHVTREQVEADGKKSEHDRREVDRLVGKIGTFKISKSYTFN